MTNDKEEILEIMDKDKCSHGRSLLFCCRCKYGERSYVEYNEQANRDTVTDLNMGIGFKLKRGAERGEKYEE